MTVLPDPIVVPVGHWPGDLWLMGRNRLLCGDSTNAADVDKVLVECDDGIRIMPGVGSGSQPLDGA